MKIRISVKLGAAALALALLCAPLFGCSGSSGETPEIEASPQPTAPPAQSKAELALAGMTLEQKVGQLFFIRPDSLDFSLTSEQINDPSGSGTLEMSDALAQALAEYPAGGVVIFGKNIESANQLSRLMSGLENASATPLLFAADEEGGLVARIANSGAFDVPKYESMAAVGAAGDPSLAREAASTIGGYLKKLGIYLDFAPVADVNTNPDNPVIGSRAFSSDPQTAADMVSAAVGGFHEAGIACCLKHYPGHGDTSGDTHDGRVGTGKSWDELLACELVPFKAGITAGADLVMVAHISASAVTGDDAPASFSHELITSKLRGELGFEGVVATDSLAMGAVTAVYSPAEAALSALGAGVDMLLMPDDYRAAYDGVLAAVRSGEMSETRIDESALRILRLKEKYGLL